ncbi:MAG TPA: rhomboid family intramembrane serine protease [Trichormus sp. M33_DOE_039]|nr:rhomboid family intramembrane serine protease [Trichormus sp. M33_DOE_039]
MIPISDNLRTYKRPIVNSWLIGINVLIFFWEIQLEIGGKLGNFIYTWGLVPRQFTTDLTNAIFVNPAAWVVVLGRLSSLLLALFLHGSFSQILGNMLFLWVFGKSLENHLGHRQYLLFYLITGVLTGLGQILVEPNLTVPLIGANGAIAAILGAYVIKFPKAQIDSILPLIIIYIPLQLPAYFYLLWWFIQQLCNSIGSLNIPPSGVNQAGLAYWMQVVGMIMGVAYMRWKCDR